MYNFLIYIFVHDCCRVPHGTRGLKCPPLALVGLQGLWTKMRTMLLLVLI